MYVEKNEMQTMSLQLSKSSPPEVIANYFKKIFELKQTGKEFPVNLDEVWPLVYNQKGKAFSTLKSDFIEGEDFYLSQMGKVVNSNKLKNGIKIDARLTVACMEYFIAKKVKTVFEVYRQVFHAAVESKQKPSTSEITKRLQDHYQQTPADKVTREVIEAAIIACGTASRLADRIGVSDAVFSHIKTRPWLVSDEMLRGIERACRNILSRSANVDTETIEQLMLISDESIRMNLFTKMRKGGLI